MFPDLTLSVVEGKFIDDDHFLRISVSQHRRTFRSIRPPSRL